jgi:hypothetical protein
MSRIVAKGEGFVSGMAGLSRYSAFAVALLALFFAAMPVHQAEAKKGRNAALIGGLAAGALIGGAIIGSQRPAHAAPGGYYGRPVYGQPVYGQPVYSAPPVYGRPVYNQPHYVEVEPDCYQVRERVWDRHRGRYVNVRRTICE